ncbi:MAG: ubiquinone biosynthesis accessory factor UbiJ [Formosimonas sp.]
MSFIDDKITQAVALAVRQMAAHEDWVRPSAAAQHNKTIRVCAELLGRPLTLTWQVDETLILRPADAEATPDVTLTLLPSVYGAAAELPFDMNRIMRHVRISGDAGLAEWVNRLAQQLRPNVWEDLSGLIGDAPTQWLAQGLSHLTRQFKQTARNLTAQAQYVALDETPVFVRHAHLDEFAAEAQELRYALDRLEQRVALLAARRG